MCTFLKLFECLFINVTVFKFSKTKYKLKRVQSNFPVVHSFVLIFDMNKGNIILSLIISNKGDNPKICAAMHSFEACNNSKVTKVDIFVIT